MSTTFRIVASPYASILGRGRLQLPSNVLRLDGYFMIRDS